MKLRDYEGSDDLTVDTGLFAEIGPYEHVGVRLPSGHVVTVYADKIYVRAPEQERHADGQPVWDAQEGITPLEPCPECDRPIGRTRGGKIRRHATRVPRGGMNTYPTCPGSGSMLAEAGR